MPNRMSATAPLSAERELTLAQEMLEAHSEQELDHFLPFILPALKLAAPLLKGVAGSLLGGLGGGSRRRPPKNQQEYFLGNIVRGLFGEIDPENEQEERFLGRVLKGLLGEQQLEAEEEQFLLGGLIGKLFGRELEAEGANYVQEQFLGGLLGKLFRGELESAQMEAQHPAPGGGPLHKRLRLARRFVRLTHMASRLAAQRLASIGHRPTPEEAQRVVLGAIIAAARRFTPRLASAFPEEGVASPQSARNRGDVLAGDQTQGEHDEWLMEMTDRQAPPDVREPMRGQATWVRRGDRLIVTF